MTTYFFTREFLAELEQKYREAGQIGTAEVIRRSISRARGRKPVAEVATDELVIVPEPPDEIWEFQIAAAEPVEVESEEL